MGVFKLPSLNHKSVAENVAITQEEERKRREEEERRAREEEERKRKEAERKAKEEAERKRKEEAERKRKEEAERRAKMEAERKRKEEEAEKRRRKEEAERRAKQDRAALDNIKSWMPNFDIFGLGSAEKDTIYKFLEECSKKEGNKVEISLRTFAKAAKIIAKNKIYIYIY